MQTSVKSLISYILLLGIIATLLLSLVRHLAWNIVLELLSHFQVQYLLFSLLLLVFLVLTRQKRLIIIGLFCVSLILSGVIYWYIPQPGLGSSSTGNLRILSANINIQNQSYAQVLSLVRKEKPDVAIFMEVNDAWVNQLKFLNDILPYAVVRPLPYNLGIAVLSKQKLENAAINFFGTTNNPSILGELRINKQVISLIATHPVPPVKLAFFHSRNQQLDQIIKYIQTLKTPVIMAGDLNITMWSPYYQRFVNKTKLVNARKGFGILPSWPTKASYSHIRPPLSWLLSIPIDHCLISPGIKVAGIRTGSNVGSDHLPLVTDLVVSK